MSGIAKLFLVLLGCAVVGVLAIGGGAWWWWQNNSEQAIQSVRDALADGRKAGSRSNESDCLSLAVARQKEIGALAIADAVRNNLFLKACLETSTAATGFCDGAPHRKDVVALGFWTMQQCARFDLNDSYCGNLMQQVSEYCASTEKASKPEPGRTGA